MSQNTQTNMQTENFNVTQSLKTLYTKIHKDKNLSEDYIKSTYKPRTKNVLTMRELYLNSKKIKYDKTNTKYNNTYYNLKYPTNGIQLPYCRFMCTTGAKNKGKFICIKCKKNDYVYKYFNILQKCIVSKLSAGSKDFASTVAPNLQPLIKPIGDSSTMYSMFIDVGGSKKIKVNDELLPKDSYNDASYRNKNQFEGVVVLSDISGLQSNFMGKANYRLRCDIKYIKLYDIVTHDDDVEECDSEEDDVSADLPSLGETDEEEEEAEEEVKPTVVKKKKSKKPVKPIVVENEEELKPKVNKAKNKSKGSRKKKPKVVEQETLSDSGDDSGDDSDIVT